MARIGCGRGMARTVSARKNRVIVWIYVAGSTHAVGIAVSDAPPRVVKSRPGPSGCIVASCASRGEDGRGRFMDGIRGAVVIRSVAAVAVGG